MKQLYSLIFIISFTSSLIAQQISVKSFQKRETDLDARVYNPKKDQNGDVCAIIKVVTTQTGFTWDPDGLGIMAAVAKVGEYWLYVPYGAKRLSIHHPQLGILRDYIYPLPIEKATVYELVLTTGKVITSVEEETIESQWLIIRPMPSNSLIYIDNKFVSTGEYQVKLKPGKYSYRAEAPFYHIDAGIFEITNAKVELDVKLKPAFGFIQVSTNPEQGAKILIDNKKQTATSPTISDTLASGEHTVQVIKEMYEPASQKVMVMDGKIIQLDFTLQSNFAEVNITTVAGATIYINGQQKATEKWSARMNAGVYSLEARLDKHRTAKQDIEVKTGDVKTVNLLPTPMYGSLQIITKPAGASISINGKEYENTPTTIEKFLTGEYAVVLSKTGYESINKTVTVSEGQTIELNETLIKSKDKNTVSKNKTNKKNTYAVSDIDGNLYHSVTIGTQTWMVENLKTTHYRNGDPIPRIASPYWIKITGGALCDYNDDEANGIKYGHLYNWYAVNDSRNIAPVGWHVPTDAEWTTLCIQLGDESEAGGKLKEVGTRNWTPPNTDATNSSGFTALPGGALWGNKFQHLGDNATWWSSSEFSKEKAWSRFVNNKNSNMSRNSSHSKFCGHSVRCLKDGNVTIVTEATANERAITISSTPIGAVLFIDGIANGTTPFAGNLTFGNHILRMEYEGKKADKTVSISQTGGETSFSISFEPPITDKDSNPALRIENKEKKAEKPISISQTAGETNFSKNFESPITDIDGNVYKTVSIGNQTWMAENLKTTHYQNGDPIPCITDTAAWKALTTGAWCDYENSADNGTKYGHLYNWYTVSDSRNIAPKGWHVPTDDEWTTLTTYLGGDSIAGGKLKEAGTLNWKSPNTGATNETGFSALPGGVRAGINGKFFDVGFKDNWWSSTENKGVAWNRYLNKNSSNMNRTNNRGKNCGFSVRCIKDEKATEVNEVIIKERAVTINSTPSGATLYIDGVANGTTPYAGNLTVGNHTLRMESEGKKAEKTVSISQTGGETSFTLSFEPPIKNFTETVNGVSFDMVAVKGGTFSMGSESGSDNEKPIHSVTLSEFSIGKTEVTQTLWQAVMGNNPSYFKGDNLPVESVSWNDCQAFITKLNQLTGKNYRLPTESEWEYAARGGNQSKGYKYVGSDNIDEVAEYEGNHNKTTKPVGGKKPNELGLYDMSGNVWEWCNDWYGTFSSSAQTNPIGVPSGSLRVFRGGSLSNGAFYCRSAYRSTYYPSYSGYNLGLRLVFSR